MKLKRRWGVSNSPENSNRLNIKTALNDIYCYRTESPLSSSTPEQAIVNRDYSIDRFQPTYYFSASRSENLFFTLEYQEYFAITGDFAKAYRCLLRLHKGLKPHRLLHCTIDGIPSVEPLSKIIPKAKSETIDLVFDGKYSESFVLIFDNRQTSKEVIINRLKSLNVEQVIKSVLIEDGTSIFRVFIILPEFRTLKSCNDEMYSYAVNWDCSYDTRLRISKHDIITYITPRKDYSHILTVGAW